MNKRYILGLITLALAGAIVGGCSSSSRAFNPQAPQSPSESAGGKTVAYKQIELLSRPAVKEAFELFEDHNTTNRSEPYADPVLQGQIKSFSEMFRSKTWAETLQAVLYPNVMKADLSQNTTKAAYLGYETGGATGSKFGGRALDDDIIDISLGAIFGNTLSALGLIPDDHKEAPCLALDNVAYDKNNTTTFPYIQAPL
ncbi:MAG: DUF4331 family protein [Candidatus Eremiobacteraeota bacterium]|nr:DUF4331 family protein [Candidatus Eremiobacteraeota bacterium]